MLVSEIGKFLACNQTRNRFKFSVMQIRAIACSLSLVASLKSWVLRAPRLPGLPTSLNTNAVFKDEFVDNVDAAGYDKDFLRRIKTDFINRVEKQGSEITDAITMSTNGRTSVAAAQGVKRGGNAGWAAGKKFGEALHYGSDGLATSGKGAREKALSF